MYTDDTPETAPARRRIVPQPLRTEAPFALIAGDTPATSELEARLKRDHPLITFPSLSHFLAEPRRAWVAIVVARSGAWDHRLDGYVRRRGCIALFGLTEESYGWPEAVARVHDLAALEAWLQALNAPQPELIKKERPKRTPRAQLAAAASAPGARWNQESAGEAKAASALPASAGNTLRPLAAATPLPRRAAPPVSLRGDRAKTRAGNGARALHKAGPRKSSAENRAELHARSVALARALAREAPRPDDRAADLKFARIAAELGLSRAFELLAELRARATRLALSMGRG
jgi:hypothetical protein